MKRFHLLLVAIFLGSVLHAFAQENITVKTVRHKMSKGYQPGYEVNIPQAELDNVKKDWIKFLEKGTKSKADDAGHEVVLKNAVKEKISPDTLSIYSMLLINKDFIQIFTFLEIKDEFFEHSRNPSDIKNQKIHSAIETSLREFAVEQYMIAVEDELKEENDALKDLEGELKDIQKDTESYKKDIASSEEKIKKYESEILLLEAEKEQYKMQLEDKRIESTNIRDKEQLKTQKKIIKGIEKSKKKIEKSIEKERKKIISEQGEISSYEAAIAKNDVVEEKKVEEINAQEEKIDLIEQKLKNIK